MEEWHHNWHFFIYLMLDVVIVLLISTTVGIVGAFACCKGDTWALEFGSIISNSDPFLITMRKRVSRGTNGGVSWIGLFVSLLGALVVGVFHYLAVWYTVDSVILQSASPQWPKILIRVFIVLV